VDYKSQDDLIYHDEELSGHLLIFQCEDIRKEHTGIHARVAILRDDINLAWTVANIEKDEERTRLSNRAHKMLKRIEEEEKAQGKVIEETMSADGLKLQLDNFCAGLWREHLKTTAPELLYGDDTDQPLEFVLRPFIVKGGGTLLFAPPGRGKSFCAQAMIVSVDAGVNILWPVQQANGLYINLERSAQSVRQRLARVNRALGLNATRPLLTLNARGHSLFDVYDAARLAVRKYDIGFVLLDSVSRGGFGDLTENNPVNKAVDALNNLCPTWLGIAHTPRGNEEHLYGSIHWEAGADVVVMLSSELKDDGTLGIGLSVDKANDFSTKQPQHTLALEFNHNGLSALRHAEKWEFPELASKHKVTMKEQVMDYLLDIGKASATDIAKETGLDRGKISTLLHNDGSFVMVERKGPSVLYGVRSQGSVT